MSEWLSLSPQSLPKLPSQVRYSQRTQLVLVLLSSSYHLNKVRRGVGRPARVDGGGRVGAVAVVVGDDGDNLVVRIPLRPVLAHLLVLPNSVQLNRRFLRYVCTKQRTRSNSFRLLAQESLNFQALGFGGGGVTSPKSSGVQDPIRQKCSPKQWRPPFSYVPVPGTYPRGGGGVR